MPPGIGILIWVKQDTSRPGVFAYHCLSRVYVHKLHPGANLLPGAN